MGELPKNHELEAALLCVDGRKFRARLDWVRKSLADNSNAWIFLTALADKNPVKFMSLVDEFSNVLFDWDDIDVLLTSGMGGMNSGKIPAIKKYKEYFKEKSLREAKADIEDRMRHLRIL